MGYAHNALPPPSQISALLLQPESLSHDTSPSKFDTVPTAQSGQSLVAPAYDTSGDSDSNTPKGVGLSPNLVSASATPRTPRRNRLRVSWALPTGLLQTTSRLHRATRHVGPASVDVEAGHALLPYRQFAVYLRRRPRQQARSKASDQRGSSEKSGLWSQALFEQNPVPSDSQLLARVRKASVSANSDAPNNWSESHHPKELLMRSWRPKIRVKKSFNSLIGERYNGASGEVKELKSVLAENSKVEGVEQARRRTFEMSEENGKRDVHWERWVTRGPTSELILVSQCWRSCIVGHFEYTLLPNT
ncbi:unnamed protein product [Protopolystoma xenopodis]|uniref:Uncharacterized protein n=1 Tax=Protopolystoma xenopodis TaxID=117903 RepID=A0A3S5CME4_9PLAT|nr:unnamed protein product [Protopolystoma xenopodis]